MDKFADVKKRKSGATWVIYDKDTNEPLSLSYHEIDYPTAKLGAGTYKLVRHKPTGMFIHRNGGKAWSHFLRKMKSSKHRDRSDRPDPDLYEQALFDYHGPAYRNMRKNHIRRIERSCSKEIIKEYNLRKTESKKSKMMDKMNQMVNGKDKTDTTSSNSNLENKKTSSDNEQNPKSIDPTEIDPRMDDRDLAVWIRLKIIGFNLGDLRDYQLVADAYKDLPVILENVSTPEEAIKLIENNDNIKMKPKTKKKIRKSDNIERISEEQIEKCVENSIGVYEALQKISQGEIDYKSKTKDNQKENNENKDTTNHEQDINTSDLSAFE